MLIGCTDGRTDDGEFEEGGQKIHIEIKRKENACIEGKFTCTMNPSIKREHDSKPVLTLKPHKI